MLGDDRMTSFDFQDEDNQMNHVEYEVLYHGEGVRPYGVRGKIFKEGKMNETAEVRERFLTREEVEKTLEMLCKFRVTPCTLHDIIE